MAAPLGAAIGFSLCYSNLWGFVHVLGLGLRAVAVLWELAAGACRNVALIALPHTDTSKKGMLTKEIV